MPRSPPTLNHVGPSCPCSPGGLLGLAGSEMPPVGLEVAGKDACRGSDYQQDLFTTCQSQKYLTSGALSVTRSGAPLTFLGLNVAVA